MKPRIVVLALTAAVLLGAAQPAEPPDHPTKFIHVETLKAELDRGVIVDIIDVRGAEQYAESHIRGARSMPLRTVKDRAPKEISKTGRVVFY